MSKKRPDSFSVKHTRVTFAMKKNESPDPTPVCLFSSQTKVPETSDVTDLVEEFPFWHCCIILLIGVLWCSCDI